MSDVRCQWSDARCQMSGGKLPGCQMLGHRMTARARAHCLEKDFFWPRHESLKRDDVLGVAE